MKKIFIILLAIIAFSCKKKDTVIPVEVKKTITVVFSQYDVNRCGGTVKYPNINVAISDSNNDTLYTATTGVDGKVVFADVPASSGYYHLHYITPAPTPRTENGWNPIESGSTCYDKPYGPSGTMNVLVEYK